MSLSHKILKSLSFGILALVVVVMIVATVVEKYQGTDFVVRNIYASPFMVALWILLSVISIGYLVSIRLYRRLFTFMIHASFILILLGAFTTYLFGLQATLHLRQGESPITEIMSRDGESHQLPFSVALNSFELKYYTGTLAPMDFVSHIEITDNDMISHDDVSMNNIVSYKNYRFYQSGYDKDLKGTFLSVSYDPYGIALTYAGYALLLLSMVGFFFQHHSDLKQLLSRLSAHSSKVMISMAFFATTFVAQASTPPSLPVNVAQAFGDIYVYYGDRICPLQTMAKDFTVKLYGKDTYKGLSSEQVLTAWFFYYDDWKREPIIKVKGDKVRDLLGVSSNYASLVDFTDLNGYKLDDALADADDSMKQELLEANEKFNVVSMACTGSSLKIFPCATPHESLPISWFAPTDNLPNNVPTDKWGFIKNSLNYLAEMVALGEYDEAEKILRKIKQYQVKEAAIVLDSDTKYAVEKIYNTYNYVRPLSMMCIVVGLLLFVVACRVMTNHSPSRLLRNVNKGFKCFAWIVFAYLTLLIAMRGYISGHFPLSNGFETMLFMAWCSLLLSLIFSGRYNMSLSFGYILCGLALMVAMIGNANPRITQLMPVLQSPLLSIHVVTIMLSYTLLAFIMLNGLTAVVLQSRSADKVSEVARLADISRLLLYPALFLLAIGIFIGAIWANISWGRYWGWDPKEVWALITMIIYAFAFHRSSLRRFQRPMFFHIYMILAFIAVLITYFGVNFFLGGMHSYA